MKRSITTLISMLMLCLITRGQDFTPLIASQDNVRSWVQSDVRVAYKEGILRVQSTGSNGVILRPGNAENFVLKGYFQLEDEAIGGILVRSGSNLILPPSTLGYLIVLDPNPDQQNTLGSVYNLARSSPPADLIVQDWNSFRIEATGDLLRVFINDKKCTELHSKRSLRGQVGFVAKGDGIIAFKDLMIKKLPDNEFVTPLLEDFMDHYPELKYQELFDGKTIKGWHAIDDGSWEVSNGVLQGRSGEKGGYLVSDKTYKNFILKASFKIKKEENSGIFIRKPLPVSSPGLENSVECNIYDFNGFTHMYSTGSLVTHCRAWSHMVDYEDWNRLTIYAFDDHVIMYVNGKKSAEAHLPAFNHSGEICLQAGLKLMSDEGGPSTVAFKDIRIKDFGDISSPFQESNH